ncbi:uncharacterized protein CC84DRAFT_1259701 [Paraphaeosphaeria sporulosa]|uniref:Zn(2)-C6 fungal-type domain-containing protein n=1 Tax=Paraphaeosphaeria sporulosa TaxID=1460663 RepID=A0A177CI48_9PLEO|nr:uncharacterized protein CC84DRAFT_1259701 [Paraphaeosphaeria sporulosa]OAG06529.1 hypothetical protein CC84DRAFT_1259701 [Paraphaeosphaeria sporulosa]
MGDKLPELHHADADGTGPVRRRRPALSCVECRKRKVKCDRARPCGPCTRIQSPTCTYRPHPWNNERESPTRRPRPVAATSSEASARNDPNSPVSGLSNDSQIDLEKKDETIQQLVDRVRQLESTLGSSSNPLPLEPDSRVDPNIHQSTAGHFVKSKFYGESHWINVLEPYDALGNSNVTVNTSTNRTEVNKDSELYVTIAECKRIARAIKASRIMQPSILADVQAYIPSRHICDQLVQGYFRTFEGVFRILHVPSFMKEYQTFWTDPAAAAPSVLLKILLVCAIGVVFYNGPEQPRLRADCTKWLQAAESWLSAPHAKSRFNMAGTQINILILLAREVCAVDGDLVWVPGGRLLRGAMHLGLHRDPSHIGKMSVFHAEMRRRLWATILEMTVQSSLDMGMPPMISPDDYDTLPPSNVNDEELTEVGTVPLQPKPLKEFTQCSMQIAFYETLPLRLEICRLINSLRFTLSYDEALKLGAEMLASCREKLIFLQSFVGSSSPHAPNIFQVKLFDTLTRRFFLCLHRPFYVRSAHDPKFYYSRKVCLDASLMIARPTANPAEGDEEDDWARLTYRCVGFIKSCFLHSLSTIYFELTSRLEDDQDTLLTAPIAISPAASHPQVPLELQPYYNALVFARFATEKRLRNGDANGKGYIWFCAALARVDALLARNDPALAVLAASKKGVHDTAVLMKEAYFAEFGENIDFSQPYPFAGKDHGRGEGADDVTGIPRSVEEHNEHGGSFERDGADFTQDMDWERLMRDESLDIGWGDVGDPQGWFGWGWDAPM